MQRSRHSSHLDLRRRRGGGFRVLVLALAAACGEAGSQSDAAWPDADRAMIEGTTWEAVEVWDVDAFGALESADWAEDCSYSQNTHSIGARIRFNAPTFYASSECNAGVVSRYDVAYLDERRVFRLDFGGGYLDYHVSDLSGDELVTEEIGPEGVWIVARYRSTIRSLP